jgi:hypothetical protein
MFCDGKFKYPNNSKRSGVIKMGFKAWIRKKLGLNYAPYSFNDDERTISQEIRRKQMELKRQEADIKLQEAKLRLRERELELQEREEELFGVEEDDVEQPESMDDKLLQFLLSRVAAVQHQSPNQPQPSQQTTKVSLSDVDIAAIAGNFTKAQIQGFNKLPHETRVKLITNQYPQIDMESIERGIAYLETH